MTDYFYLYKRFFQVGTMKHIYEPGERTPYPVIIEQPTFRDVIHNMELPEFVPFLISIPLGTYMGYRTTFNLQDVPQSRRQAFGMLLGLTMVIHFYMGMKGSAYKLMGFENNGLRWPKPEHKVKKYDFTSDFHGFWEDIIRSEELDSL